MKEVVMTYTVKNLLTRNGIEKLGGRLISQEVDDSVEHGSIMEIWELPNGTLWCGCSIFVYSDDGTRAFCPFRELNLEVEDMPGWALDDYLRTYGHDPEKVAREIAELVERSLAEVKARLGSE